MKADFHVHTTISDGSDMPREVFRKAKENGVTHLAITDHDTMYGQEIHRALAEEHGITYVPGIEISAYDHVRGNKCHIIGLYVKPGYEPLDTMIEKITAQRHQHSDLQVQKLIDLGFDITFDDFQKVRGYHGIYKQHIMDVLIQRQHADEFFGDFYNSIFKGDGPLNMKVDYPSHIEAVKAIKASGGVPVLAHPTIYGNMDAVEELVEVGLQGIEAYYPTASAEATWQIEALAGSYGLFLSGGSDYHGRYAGHDEGTVGSHTVSDISRLEQYRLDEVM